MAWNKSKTTSNNLVFALQHSCHFLPKLIKKSRPQIFFRPSTPWQVMRVMAWLRKLASVPTCEAVMASFTPSSNRCSWTFCLQVQMAIKRLSFRAAGTANLMSFFFFWNSVFFFFFAISTNSAKHHIQVSTVCNFETCAFPFLV